MMRELKKSIPQKKLHSNKRKKNQNSNYDGVDRGKLVIYRGSLGIAN